MYINIYMYVFHTLILMSQIMKMKWKYDRVWHDGLTLSWTRIVDSHRGISALMMPIRAQREFRAHEEFWEFKSNWNCRCNENEIYTCTYIYDCLHTYVHINSNIWCALHIVEVGATFAVYLLVESGFDLSFLSSFCHSRWLSRVMCVVLMRRRR